MASDVDIVIAVATAGVADVYKLSNAMQQLNAVVRGSVAPMNNLSARSKALSAAVGSADSSLKAHAKTIDQLSRNNSVLTNEIGRVRKEIAGMGTEFKFATGASASFRKAAVSDLKAYESALKGIRLRGLTEDLKSVAQEQKRLGKDAQFVGRSLIIGLTTPMVGFARYGLQALVSVDKEFVRLNKVLENVAPNLEAAAKKMNVDLVGATKEQSKQLQGMVDRYDRLDKSLGKISNRFGLAKSLTVGLAGDFAELGIQSEESIAKITELAAVTEKLGDMDIGAAKDLVQSLYFQAQRAMQMSGQSRKMTFEEREIAAIGAATAQLNLFNSVENVTALTLRDLGDAFPEVAAAGSSFGLSMTELAGMLAPMKAAGFEVGASANSIKVSLQRLVAPTKQNADLFRRLSKEYDTNFTAIKGTGLDAIQSLIDGFNELKNSAAGQEGAMEFFAKVFGVRQGPRMEVALAQMADFDEVLKSNTVSLESAEKKLQGFANQAIISANKSSNANLPLIKSYQDIGIIARIATAQIKEGETAQIDGFGRVTLAQVKEARKVRQAVTDEIVKAQRTEGVDLIGQVNTEAGRASFIQLAGAANAAEVAQRELDVALGSLDTQISILKNNFKAFATDIIKGARPAIEKITDISNKLITAWSSLDGRTKQLISTVALLVAGATAAIGPLIFVFGQFRLAMGSVAKVLLSFLPSLKTLSVEAVASSSAMLRLSKPLTVVGDTVVNTNGKFATFLATLASGEGPVGRLANKIGLMTGALQEQSTAPMALSRQVNAQKAVRESLAPITGTSVIDPITGAPVAAKPSFTSQMKSALKLQKTGVMSGAAGVRGPSGRMGPMDADEREILRKTEEMIKQSLLAKGYPTTGGRGPGGRFSKSVGDMVQEAVALQASGVTSGAAGIRGASGRFRRMTTGEKDALQAYEDTRETLEKRTLAKRTLSRKNLDLDVFTGQNMYKGREITADRASDIYRGGIKGRAAQVAEAVGRSREAAPDRIKELGGTAKGLATAPIEGYKKSVKGAKDAMLALRMQHAAAGVEAPRFFARMSAAMKGFVTSTNLGTAALKIMKLTLIASGIGIIILAIGVAVMLVMKNLDSFKKAGSSGIKTVKEAFTTVKDAVLELVRPIIDLFAHFGNGAKGSEGAVQGLGKAFSGIAVVFKFVANVFKMIVEKFIKPYLYMIINIVGAVVSLFQGNWKKAFSFLMAAVAFAAEFFVNAFAIGFKVIVSLAGGLVKGVVSLIGLLAKGMIEYLVWPITGVLKLASMLPFGIGDKFKGINNKFRSVVNGAKGMVDSATSVVNSTVDKATGAVNGLIDKSAKGIKNKLGGLKKGGIDASKGKVTLGGKGKKDDNVEVDTDPMQEQIANATGEGLSEGADEGAKELAKRAAQALKDIKKEVQEEIASRIKDAMTAVVESITNSLKDQKEASLLIYDAQIKKIEDVAKAEEKLTKEQEYQNKLREAEEQRALNRLNTRRNYAMAVYAGQIDEARAIADAGARQDTEDTKSIGVIRDERVKELAEENRKVMIDSIKEAKENASKYFDEMIKSFTEAAKKITQFPPTTAEEFNTMLNQLIDGGNGFVGAKSIANSMGTVFSESFGGALGQLGVNASGPLTSSLAAIGKTLTENNPFGPTGIWSKTIDASIDALTRKYTGLSQTLTTVIDTNSEAFSKLLTTYTAYQDIVNPAGAGGSSSSGGSGGGGTGAGGSGAGAGGTGTGGGTGNETGLNNLKKGKVTPNQLARVMFANYRNADRNLLVDYLTDAFTIFTKPPVDSSANKFKKFLTENPAIKQTKNSRILTMVRNAYNTGSRSEGYDGYKLYEMGGMLPYSKGGPTEGPVQQGIPAILHGGEFVVRNSAVNKYGWGMMQQINQGTYKPKPFANGGMIDSFAKGGAIKKPKKMVTGGKSKAPERAPDKKIKEDPAQAEWNWQQNNGGFTEAYMDTIGKGESSRGKNWGKKPDWFGRAKTSDGWMGGGLRTADDTWVAYGGLEFGKTADLATKLQQMVVKNRIAIFGWIRNVPVNSPGFPAGATLLNPPLGTGKHGFDRSHLLSLERGLFKGKPEKLKKYRSPEQEFPLPENFNPNMSYISQLGYDPFKNFGSDKGAFNTKASKDAYVNYFRNKPKGFDKITMPFSKPIWIDSFKKIVKGPKNARNFDSFGAYSPDADAVGAFGYYKGGLVKGKKPDEKKPASAADFRKADFLSAFEMQRIGEMAKEQAQEQKKSIWGKIKSAVKKPFVAAKNWASNRLMAEIYGSQTGSGFTGSAVMLNRATNPKYEHVHPSGKPTMLDLPSVRAGAGLAKTLTEFNPITGAYFPLERTFDIHNEGLSGKDRTLAGLQSAVSLIGPDTVFGLNAPRNPSTFLPRVQDSLSNSYWTFINNNKPLNRIYSEARHLKEVIKPPTPTVDIAGRPIKVGPEAWFHYFDERSPMVKSIKEFNPAQTTRSYPNLVSKIFGTRYGNKLGLPKTPKPQKKIISKISDYLIPSKTFSNFGNTSEDWLSMYNDYLVSPSFLRVEQNRLIKENVLSNILESKKGRTGSFTRAMIDFEDYSGRILSNGKRAIKPGTKVGIKTLIDQIMGDRNAFSYPAITIDNLNQVRPMQFDDLINLFLNSKNPNQFVRKYIEQHYDYMSGMGFNMPANMPKRKTHIDLMMKDFRENDFTMSNFFEAVRSQEHIVDPNYASNIVNQIVQRTNSLTDHYQRSAIIYSNKKFFTKSPIFNNMDSFESLMKAGVVDPELLGKMRTSLVMDTATSGRITVGQILDDGISQLSSMSFEIGQMYDKNHYPVTGFKVGMWNSYADTSGKQTTLASIASNRILGAIYEMVMKPLGAKVIYPGSMSKYSFKVASELSETMKSIDPSIEIIGDYSDAVQRLERGDSFNGIGFTGFSRPFTTSANELRNNLLGFSVGRGGISTPEIEARITAATKRIALARIALRKAMKNKEDDFGIGNFNGGLISRANGGIIPGFGSQGVPALLHGGEYVVNASAVKNIGIAALQAMNNMRFNTPKAPSYSGPVNGQSTSTSTTHIYVENFIGEKQWFESMMKDYNVTIAPQNQKAAGLNNTTISTYSGINRGL
jgi:TP901 family phage tail tape measure protein